MGALQIQMMRYQDNNISLFKEKVAIVIMITRHLYLYFLLIKKHLYLHLALNGDEFFTQNLRAPSTTLQQLKPVFASLGVEFDHLSSVLSTLALVKPDALPRAGEFLSLISERTELSVAGLRLLRLTSTQARAFYQEHRERAFFG